MGATKGGAMAATVYAQFTARDGSGLWEVTSAGVRVNGELWRWTDHSSVVCAITPGHTERSSRLVEEPDDGFGALAALAVYQETGSLSDAGLAAWALGGSTVRTEVSARECPGTIQLSINGLRRPRDLDCSLRYREDGRWVQAEAVQAFADAVRAAIRAHRARWD